MINMLKTIMNFGWRLIQVLLITIFLKYYHWMYAKGYVTRAQISIGGEQGRDILSHLNALIEHSAATNIPAI